MKIGAGRARREISFAISLGWDGVGFDLSASFLFWYIWMEVR